MLKSILKEKAEAMKEFDKKIAEYVENQPKEVTFDNVLNIEEYDVVYDERDTESGYFSILKYAMFEVTTNTGTFIITVNGSLGKFAAASVAAFKMPKMSETCGKLLHNAFSDYQDEMCEQTGFLKGLHYALGFIGEKQCEDYEFDVDPEKFDI